MSKRAFLEEWIGENANAITPLADTPESDDSEARLLAEQCLSDGKDEGIAKEDLEEEVGDLVTYMASKLGALQHNELDQGEDQERRTRTRAWKKGCPKGRAARCTGMTTEVVAVEKTNTLLVKM
jgi:hypothetical protein